MSGFLFSKKLRKSQPVDDDTENTRVLQVVVENSSPKKDGISIGAAMRNEKIENARIIATAARQHRQQKATVADPTCIMQNALAERLKAKLLVNEKECSDLRNLAEVARQGIPVSLSLLQLGFEPENVSCLVDDVLFEKLEALVVSKENECAKVRKLLAQVSKRESMRVRKLLVEASKTGMSRNQDGGTTKCVSPLTRTKVPRPILRKQPSSSKITKAVTWGALSV
jgi:hypothetical protein